MNGKPTIFVIIGSASARSANQYLVAYIGTLLANDLHFEVFQDLKTLPPFDPDLSIGDPPPAVRSFREAVERASGVLICTPEYVFSIPSGLKNAIEWCVATTVFSDKPVALITASAHGEKGHEQLQLLMRTLGARFRPETTLLVQGVKGKVSPEGALLDQTLGIRLQEFTKAFQSLLNE